jgi:tRNA A-37 threonylcarbamoyl transferase component Bud32
LLTAFLAPSDTLACAWGSSPSAEKARLLAPALHLLGRLHAAGLIHNDLHLGNFLRFDGKLYIVDGDAVRMIRPGRPLYGRNALRNLTRLLALLPDQLQELIEAYRQSNPSFRMHPHKIQKAVRKKRETGMKRFLKKSVRDCTPFAVCRTFRRFTAVVRDQKKQLAPLLDDPDQSISNGSRLKTGGSSTVACAEIGGKTVVIKRYNLKSLQHAFSRLWRPSRAWRSWQSALRLQYIGLPTPEPLALIEERFGRLRRRAWLITAFCPGPHLLNHLDPDCEPPAEEAAAILSFCTTLCRERISHGDLKATNLLWHEGRLTVIDLDAAKKHFFAATHRRAWQKDRARLLRNWPAASALHRWLDTNLPR